MVKSVIGGARRWNSGVAWGFFLRKPSEAKPLEKIVRCSLVVFNATIRAI